MEKASYSVPTQILHLVPDKWSRMYFSEYFNILEYLVWTSHETKKVGEILAKPAPETKKSYNHWNTSSSNPHKKISEVLLLHSGIIVVLSNK